MNRVICIKWGEKYGADYVNRMQRMLERHTVEAFQLICFTDNAEGIDAKVEVHPLPELRCEIPKTVPGKFPKLALWGGELPIEDGPVLFIDLDTVLVGCIDEYFAIGDPMDVYLARNWTKPFSGLGQTSVFRFPVGGHTYILENLRKDTKELAEKFRYEQHYVTKNVEGGVKFWPEKWTKHFRVHCMGLWPLRYVRKAKLPKGAKIITFPGMPDPKDAILGRFSSSYPSGLKPMEYVKYCFTDPKRKKRPFNALKKYVPKFDWLKEEWGDAES
ncbi:glycosyl transferase [Rubritalea spongiae]|uniref:Glycosyl transferase n=1 Tax=Rubritalea spongiae TaxID=430797 RepID=A0ABW5E4E5_9BACT